MLSLRFELGSLLSSGSLLRPLARLRSAAVAALAFVALAGCGCGAVLAGSETEAEYDAEEAISLTHLALAQQSRAHRTDDALHVVPHRPRVTRAVRAQSVHAVLPIVGHRLAGGLLAPMRR